MPEVKSRRRREVEVETKMVEGFGHKGIYMISKFTGFVKVSMTSFFKGNEYRQ